MQAERIDSGDIAFRSLPDVCADALREIPVLLASSDPRVRERLHPPTFDDEEREAEWRRIAGPELEHLIADRVSLVKEDLRTLQVDQNGTFSMTIDQRREAAWLSALNAARLALFVLNGLVPADMERDPHELDDPSKGAALLDIHLLAWVQELIMRTTDFAAGDPGR